MSIQNLHYENLGGMLIRREGLLNWRCPLCKAEGQSPEVMRACPECGSKEATLPGAQNVPSFADAYQGAMEEVAIWKKRALEAEDLNRKFVAEINGPTYMGEPAQPAPSVLDGLTPLEAIQYWADAYANPKGDAHFIGHSVVERLLREYADLRAMLSAQEAKP